VAEASVVAVDSEAVNVVVEGTEVSTRLGAVDLLVVSAKVVVVVAAMAVAVTVRVVGSVVVVMGAVVVLRV